MLNSYDVHLILSCIANYIHDIDKYNDKCNIGLLKDYKVVYYKLKKFMLSEDFAEGDKNV